MVISKSNNRIYLFYWKEDMSFAEIRFQTFQKLTTKKITLTGSASLENVVIFKQFTQITRLD